MLTRTAKLGGAAALAAPILTVALPAAQAAASGAPGTYSIMNMQYMPGTGFSYYQYTVSGPSGDSISPNSDLSGPVYAGYPDSLGTQAPTTGPYVEISVNSTGKLVLTLFQYNGAGSATYTAPGGSATCELTGGSSAANTCELTGSSPMATATGFSSGTANLVVSST